MLSPASKIFLASHLLMQRAVCLFNPRCRAHRRVNIHPIGYWAKARDIPRLSRACEVDVSRSKEIQTLRTGLVAGTRKDT